MIRIPRDLIPTVTADQMRRVDRAMIEDLHIELVQMMENAGRSLADLAVRVFDPSSAVILAGRGGNGGGGLVAARHLANRGRAVRVVLGAGGEEMAPVPAHQLDILHRMGVPIVSDPPAADVVVDALIGYSLRGDPAGRTAELIEWANRQTAPVLSLDAPSGLDVTTGLAGHPCVRAAATLTLALPKVGLLVAPGHVGRLYLADISVPGALYERMGLKIGDVFSVDPIVEIAL